MIPYILGIITGLIIALLIAVIVLRHNPQIKRHLHRVENLTGLKGQIIEPENEELANWVDNLKDQ